LLFDEDINEKDTFSGIVFYYNMFLFCFFMLSSIDDGAMLKIHAPSYLGVGLGMIRDSFCNGDFVSKYASKY
jgi:hypothetical protein